MKALFLLLLVTLPLTANADPVYCQKVDEINGPIVMFEGFCPIGWYRVYL